ncbi:LSM domain-containing protein [Microsporum canis CBS 113480]|uniref:Sm protein F n=1 Tax=Arthroderma otae (strain ATCC MYA-4605 / CBS 113480) TaxID=554155 RepID=C5FXN1_ARTOC|nr:LSM domain-containing protein [Microsporum canis CBS 113480]EEQ35071.1 LSM domain-containing protein [Microsporum canis CBS 113480]
MSFVPLNPRPMLQSLINDDIVVRLKWGQTEYKGRLVSVDSYMNIQLSQTEEFIDGRNTGTLGEVLIRVQQRPLDRECKRCGKQGRPDG